MTETTARATIARVVTYLLAVETLDCSLILLLTLSELRFTVWRAWLQIECSSSDWATLATASKATETCSQLLPATGREPGRPLLDPRPLKPRLNTVLGVTAAVKWLRATRTALIANRANCAASVTVFGALSLTCSLDTSLVNPLTNCLIKMC